MLITGSLLAGSLAAGLASGAASAGVGALGASNARKDAYKASETQYLYNLALMREQQQYEERMSNTAHQREMADLAKAGLNPILTATGGSGASTPTTGLNSVNAPNYSTARQDGVAIAGKAMELFKYKEELRNLMANTNSLNANADETYTRSMLNSTENRIKLIDELNLPKKWERELKLMNADILLKNTQSSALQSEKMLNFTRMGTEREQQQYLRANTKYTNERARGFTETVGGSGGHKFGIFGLSGGKDFSDSYTRTY